MMPMTCLLCDPPRRLPASSHREYLDTHYDRTHGHLAGLPDDLTGPGQSWHAAAIAEVKRLAATGQPFQAWQIFAAVGDPPDHKTANGKFTAECESLGLIHVAGYAKSKRPGANQSKVCEWRGGPKPARSEVA